MSASSMFDGNLFDPNNISKETADFNAEVHKVMSELPPTYTLEPQQIRDDREAGKGLWPVKRHPDVVERTIPGPVGDIPIRVYVPEEVKGVYLHIHGGGFMLGRAHHQDAGNVLLATACKVATVSVDYRLAPEDPHPAGPDDCEAAAVWLSENAVQEFGTERLLIGGESAGANLSAVTLLRMRNRHGFTGFAGANLVYGGYDLAMTPSAGSFGEDRKLVLTTKTIQWFHDNYVSDDKRSDPDVSPLYADLYGMPAALFTVGTIDPLLDDSLFMHARWTAAGNNSALAVYPGGIHAFNAFPIEIADLANARIHEFLSGILEK